MVFDQDAKQRGASNGVNTETNVTHASRGLAVVGGEVDPPHVLGGGVEHPTPGLPVQPLGGGEKL